MTRPALILFAHGARDPEWASPLQRVREAVRTQAPQLRVELAFLEFMAPNLEDCVGALVAAGCGRIIIAPMFIAQGGHLKNDVPLIVDRLRTRHPGLVFDLCGPIGEAEGVVQAMAAHLLQLSSA
ncbi:MAG: CbiX/SirB N-terminal domain-containing protein [Propionivibrio sp.]